VQHARPCVHARDAEQSCGTVQVVTLDAGTTALVYTGEDLARLQAVVQDSHATAEELILALRKLSCHEISLQDLQETVPLLHPSVQARTIVCLL
jgi:hypothetical protein